MANPFVHIELSSTDLDASKRFYTGLFGWQLQDVPMANGPTYTMIQVGEGTGGGMVAQQQPGAPSAWLPYVLVDDIRASTAKAAELGAAVMLDSMEVPGMGWLSIFQDPTGATLGLWQAKPPG